MIPQEELDRALRRWKARKLGHEVPTAVAGEESVRVQIDSPHEDPTRVASHNYSSQVETPPAEVHLGEADFEDHTHNRR